MMFLEVLIFGGFVVLMLVVAGPSLLATFFVAVEHGMVPLQMNESKGRHCQPFFIFNIYVARSRGFEIMSSKFVKK